MLPGQIQYPDSQTPKTMEAVRILKYMGMKSSRSNLVCLQHCLMGHKEENIWVWCLCSIFFPELLIHIMTCHNVFITCPFLSCNGRS